MTESDIRENFINSLKEDKDTNNLLQSLSLARLDWYIDDYLFNNNNLSIFDKYKYNTLISSKIYVVFNYFEITFRNFCDKRIRYKTHNEKWYLDTNIVKRDINDEKDYINKVFFNVCKRYKENKKLEELPKIEEISSDDFIANTDFGFWVELFDKKRASEIYNKFFFKFFIDKKFTAKDVKTKLHYIRYMRNRIAHQECIIKYDYKLKYDYMIKLIKIISRRTLKDLSIIDDFKKIDNNYKNSVKLS
ncbi:MAG: hypothetical protein Ta2D_02430 [Rickettsiales bacterium]|nr:MAG: hypothetical protein Ta2D_02430 [Rickettsiales bacterium]